VPLVSASALLSKRLSLRLTKHELGCAELRAAMTKTVRSRRSICRCERWHGAPYVPCACAFADRFVQGVFSMGTVQSVC